MKHISKQWVALLLCLVMAVGLLPAAFAEGSIEPEEGIVLAPDPETAQAEAYDQTITWRANVGFEETLTISGGYPAASWKSSKPSVVSVNSSGRIRCLKPGNATVTGTSIYGTTDTYKITVLFSDVQDPKLYYYTAVYWAADNGIAAGYNGQTFGVHYGCTRADMLTFLWRLAGRPEPYSTYSRFPDVNNSSVYYYKPVLWAVERGITNGYSDGYFRPMNICTREQAMTFLWRMRGKPEPLSTYNPFYDVKRSDYFYKAVLWAMEQGITKGYSDGSFGVGRDCQRQDMATFLYRYAA